MRGLQQQGVQGVAGGGGEEDSEPCNARAKQATGKQPEQETKCEIAEQMLQTRVQRQCRNGSPPFARAYQGTINTAGDLPVLRQGGRRDDGGDASNNQCVAEQTGHGILVHDRRRFRSENGRILIIIEHELVHRSCRERSRHDQRTGRGVVNNLKRNLHSRKHQRPIGTFCATGAFIDHSKVVAHILARSVIGLS
jgi:hypothetical protein